MEASRLGSIEATTYCCTRMDQMDRSMGSRLKLLQRFQTLATISLVPLCAASLAFAGPTRAWHVPKLEERLQALQIFIDQTNFCGWFTTSSFFSAIEIENTLTIVLSRYRSLID